MGYLLSSFGLKRFVPLRARIRRYAQPRHYTKPEHVRMAFEELGATFIKLGQILSTRADLIPLEYRAELAKLQDQAPPVDGSLIRKKIVEELGCPIEKVFATFDPEPIAAASIGQAHAATLHNGAKVMVKVRRPGVVKQIEEDLEIIQNLAKTASRHWEFASYYDLPGLAQEFAQTLRAELDYIREGRNAERFAIQLANNPVIHIPRVYWETTTESVLTLERIQGIKINDLAALDVAGIDRAQLADRAARLVLQMILENGFYHADPHPGNFFIEPGGSIGLVDYGMVGIVDDRTQEQLIEVFLAIASQETDPLVDIVLKLGFTRGRVNRAQMERDLQRLLSQYYGKPFAEIDIGPLLTEVLTIVRRHHLQLPSNLALLFKTLLMDEALGTMLDPTFNMASVLEPYSKLLVRRLYSPGYWWRNVSRAGMDAARLGVELPQQLRRLLADLERGNIEVGVNPDSLTPLINDVKQLVHRVVLGIITAAFIIGLATLLPTYRSVIGIWGIGVFFVIGLILAFVLGGYLATAMLRSRKK
jgi:ubiquinone biosynthesis protein